MIEDNTNNGTDNDKSLRSITQGASLYSVGWIISNGLGFVFNLILTRVLGATLYGIYTYANTIISFLVIFARLGTGKSLLKFIPAFSDDPAQQNWVTGLAYLTAIVGSVTVSITLFVLAPVITALTIDEPVLIVVLRILSIVLPFNTLINLTNAVFRSLEQLEYQVLIANIFNPIVRIFAVSSAFALGYSLIGAVAALAIGTILIFIAALSLLSLKTDIQLMGDRSKGSIYEFYDFSIPLTLKDVGTELHTRVDLLMVGFFLAGSVVGIYRVALLLAMLLTLPLSAVNQLFPPVASNLYASGKTAELELVYKIITRWVFTITIPPALLMVIYSSEVLRIFGEAFTGGALVLVFFTIARLSTSAVGPSGYLLMMTNHQYLNLMNQWVLGVLNVILNYIFIIRFGFIGAAAATTGTFVLISVIRVIEIWYLERMTPYSSKYWKPVVAGACGALVMVGWRFFLNGYPLLIVGSATGSLVFIGVLVVFGIENEDQEFYLKNIKPRFKRR